MVVSRNKNEKEAWLQQRNQLSSKKKKKNNNKL
jgi:hypothetical protein